MTKPDKNPDLFHDLPISEAIKTLLNDIAAKDPSTVTRPLVSDPIKTLHQQTDDAVPVEIEIRTMPASNTTTLMWCARHLHAFYNTFSSCIQITSYRRHMLRPDLDGGRENHIHDLFLAHAVSFLVQMKLEHDIDLGDLHAIHNHLETRMAISEDLRDYYSQRLVDTLLAWSWVAANTGISFTKDPSSKKEKNRTESMDRLIIATIMDGTFLRRIMLKATPGDTPYTDIFKKPVGYMATLEIKTMSADMKGYKNRFNDISPDDEPDDDSE